MADFTYEGVDPLGRGEEIDGGVYTFVVVDPPSKLLADVPFNVTAKNYDEAVKKLKEFIRDAEVVAGD